MRIYRSFLLGVAVVLALAASPLTPHDPEPAQAASSSSSSSSSDHDVATRATTPALGAHWFALGSNTPWIHRGCDFRCGAGRGIRGTSAQVDRMFRSMSRRGVRVVRWQLFPGAAPQVLRGADGRPRGVSLAARQDFAQLVSLARKHDVYLLPTVFPNPHALPRTWFTDHTQRVALARSLRSLQLAHRNEPHVLGWELMHGADQLVEGGVLPRAAVRSTARTLLAHARVAAPGRLRMLGVQDVTGLDVVTGLGATAYGVHDTGGRSGVRCASCRRASALGADAPIIVTAFTERTNARALQRLRRYERLGYAGALTWSWRGRPAPGTTAVTRPLDEATWRFAYEHDAAGPHARPLNPCFGPDARRYRCPNLRMDVPQDLSLGTRDGRRVLFSRNSINSVGAGPASIHGSRNGTQGFRMSAVQLLHRRVGRPVSIHTGAKLQFKAIPGQYRYWKWDGAAQMELWRLDASGTPVQRVRVGPKTVYCLRDLRRTRANLPSSPRSMQYPACSQNPNVRSVTLGTSVGWSDIYPWTYYENWIDVRGLRGCFAYVHVADPDNVIYESNEDDNTSSVVVRLPFTGSNRGCPGAKPLPVSGESGVY